MPRRIAVGTSAAIPSSYITSPAAKGRRENENANRPLERPLIYDAYGSSQSESDRMLQSRNGLGTNSHQEFGNGSEGLRKEIPTPAPNTETAIIFRLVSRERPITHCFPLEKCSSVRNFFRKSEEFFSLIGRSMKTRSLSCKITESNEERYVYENIEVR